MIPSNSKEIPAGKWGPLNEHVFPIKHGDIPASYVSLPEGTFIGFCFGGVVIPLIFPIPQSSQTESFTPPHQKTPPPPAVLDPEKKSLNGLFSLLNML